MNGQDLKRRGVGLVPGNQAHGQVERIGERQQCRIGIGVAGVNVLNPEQALVAKSSQRGRGQAGLEVRSEAGDGFEAVLQAGPFIAGFLDFDIVETGIGLRSDQT